MVAAPSALQHYEMPLQVTFMRYVALELPNCHHPITTRIAPVSISA